MKYHIVIRTAVVVGVLAVAFAWGHTADATHAWGNYHWARTANPFTLQLGDNVSSAWDSYLNTASNDWSQSSVLNTTVVPGNTNPKNCRATNGRVEVCNAKYGNNGWLGVAQVWASGNHITQSTVKMNDTYFAKPAYNTPAWRRLVMCQEIGHAFGLDHQDENFSNANLGTCMDYTNDPDGPPSNEHPNAHDYEMLETIYAHLDSFTTILLTNGDGGGSGNGKGKGKPTDNPSEWGKALRKDAKGRTTLHERDFGGGEKVFTFVVWAENE